MSDPAVVLPINSEPSIERKELLEFLATHPRPDIAAAKRSAPIAMESNAALEHTIDHENCPACQAAEEGLNVDSSKMREMEFTDAAREWKKHRNNNPNHRPRTHESVDGSLASLEKFFGRVKMRSINAGMLLSYQHARKTNTFLVGGVARYPWRKAAGNSAINHDLGVMGQMLEFCGLWAKIAPEHYPLPIKPWSPRQKIFQSDEEEQDFFRRLAESDDEMVQTALWAALVTNNTTASGIELRGLRLENVMLEEPGKQSSVYIPEDACKNGCRPRRLALNDTARFALANLVKRAHRLGSTGPGHYLFPFRDKRGKYDPTKRAARGHLRRAWDKLREVTGRPDITPHLLRHLAITKLLEKGVTGDQIRDQSGQVSSKMVKYYSHTRLKSSAEILGKIDQPNVIPFESGRRKRGPRRAG